MTTIERIERTAKKTYPITDTSTFSGMCQDAFIEGAKYERNKAIQEAIDALKENSWFDIFGERANTEITKKLESLKITP